MSGRSRQAAIRISTTSTAILPKALFSLSNSIQEFPRMIHFQRPALAALVLILAMQSPALAVDGKVYSPRVVKGEAELEYAGTRSFDSNKDKNDIQQNEFSIGYGFTDYWK